MIMKGDHPFCGPEFLPLLQYDIGTSDTFIGRESHVIDNNKIKFYPEEVKNIVAENAELLHLQ